MTMKTKPVDAVIIDESKRQEMLTLKEQLVMECQAMAKYALQNGKKVPSDTATIIDNVFGHNHSPTEIDLKKITLLHHELSKIVDPAKPSTILLLCKEKQKGNPLNLFGPVPLVRSMIFTAMAFLIAFVLICTSPEVNSDTIQRGFFHEAYFTAFLNSLLLIISAGLGATFSILFTVNKYIVNGNYDPKYEASYWIRLILGIMAGLILASMIPIDFGSVTAELSMEAKDVISSTDMEAFSKLLLAMLGGFSSTLLYKILARFVETIESLVSGSPKDVIHVQTALQKAKLSEDNSNNLMKISAKLSKFRSELNSDMPLDDIKRRISSIADDIFSSHLGEGMKTEQDGSYETMNTEPGTSAMDDEYDSGRIDREPVIREPDDFDEETIRKQEKQAVS